MSFRKSWKRVSRDLRALVRRLLDDLFGFLDDLDVQLLEHAVELVDLAGVERQLVQRDRDLVGRQLAGLAPSLKKLPCFLDFEDAPRRHSTCCDLLPSAQLGSPSPVSTVVAARYDVNVLFFWLRGSLSTRVSVRL